MGCGESGVLCAFALLNALLCASPGSVRRQRRVKRATTDSLQSLKTLSGSRLFIDFPIFCFLSDESFYGRGFFGFCFSELFVWVQQFVKSEKNCVETDLCRILGFGFLRVFCTVDYHIHHSVASMIPKPTSFEKVQIVPVPLPPFVPFSEQRHQTNKEFATFIRNISRVFFPAENFRAT